MHLGVPVPAVRRAVLRRTRTEADRSHAATVRLAEELWQQGVHELRLAATELLIDRADLLSPDDLPFIERLMRQARTWALIDGLAPGVVGPLLVRYPQAERTVQAWAADPDLWVRRAAVLSYLKVLPGGEADFESFATVADPLLEDREFFVRKALGWVLREHGKRSPDQMFAWLWPRRDRAARLTLREAAKYLGADMKEALLSTVVP